MWLAYLAQFVAYLTQLAAGETIFGLEGILQNLAPRQATSCSSFFLPGHLCVLRLHIFLLLQPLTLSLPVSFSPSLLGSVRSAHTEHV